MVESHISDKISLVYLLLFFVHFFYISCGLNFERRYVKVPHLANVNETANLLSAEFLRALEKNYFKFEVGYQRKLCHGFWTAALHSKA